MFVIKELDAINLDKVIAIKVRHATRTSYGVYFDLVSGVTYELKEFETQEEAIKCMKEIIEANKRWKYNQVIDDYEVL